MELCDIVEECTAVDLPYVDVVNVPPKIEDFFVLDAFGECE